MANKKQFKSHRVTGVKKVNTGAGTYTIAIPFVPNFIDVVFFGMKKTNKAETLTFDLNTTATGYDLVIHYHVEEPRSIRHVVAILPIDPEETIAH